MDFYQGVVIDYLRADRAIFLNAECCLQIEEKKNPDDSDPHWYCDAVALDFRDRTIFLCEISFADQLSSLIDRLKAWTKYWPQMRIPLQRECRLEILNDWPIRPWLFVKQASVERLVKKLELMIDSNGEVAFRPRITPLEMVQPWLYHSWDHQDKDTPKPMVPEPYRY